MSKISFGIGRRCLLVIAALGVAVAGGGCRKGDGAAAIEERITVAATAYVGNCSIAAADANGYFAAEGLQITIRAAATGKDALAEVMNGQADLATVADVPVMFAVLAQQPVAVIATISTATQDHGIVGRRAAGVGAPADLRGKRIGVPSGTSAHYFLDAFLNSRKIAGEEVRLVNLAPEQLSGALLAGDIDAMAIWQPFVNDGVRRLGASGSVFYGEGVYDVMYNLAGTTRGVAARRGAFERFLKAVTRGTEFCRRNPLEGQKVVASGAGLDAERVKEMWPAYRFRVGLAQALLLALEHETRWAMKNHFRAAPSAPNYLDHLQPGPLEAVAPAAVTVIH